MCCRAALESSGNLNQCHVTVSTYVALKLRGLLVVKLLWRVRNHVVVTLTLLKFLLVAVLKGNFQSSDRAQHSSTDFSPALCNGDSDTSRK